MLLNFAVTIGVSAVTPAPPAHVRAMVENLRRPDHPGQAIALDEAME